MLRGDKLSTNIISESQVSSHTSLALIVIVIIIIINEKIQR